MGMRSRMARLRYFSSRWALMLQVAMYQLAGGVHSNAVDRSVVEGTLRQTPPAGHD